MRHLHDKTVLVVGGDYDKCQLVAQKYGFKHAVTPGDLVVAYPDLWPFSKVFLDFYRRFAKPLPKGISSPSNPDLQNALKIDAIFVYNDPRDWGLDSSVILDTLLSKDGYIGTLSEKNGDMKLQNRGYLQDGQPPLYYSNPDLWWATSYHLDRLGQGGFKAAFDGLWKTVTGGAKLNETVIGKPSQETYEFAENRLLRHRKTLFRNVGLNDPLRRVYMIGDNPESDIAGANNYRSPHGSKWTSVLLKTGVYKEGTEPTHKPHVMQDNVLKAVEWAVEDARRS
jgi:HAD superfamily hydrolase (TIGR01456 family)